MSKLARLMQSGLMAVSHHCKQEGGPAILACTVKEIANTAYPQWLKNQDTLLHFAQEYLSKNDFIAFKCWDEGMQTAEALMHLDICHYIIEQLQIHGQQT